MKPVFVAMAVVATGAMGCSLVSGQQTLVERQLPGFSVKVPEGRPEREKSDDYADGILKIPTGGGLVMVTWHPRRGEDEGQLLQGMLTQMGATGVHPAPHLKGAGLAVQSLVGRGKGQDVAVSSIRCGEREVLLWTRLPRGAERLQERMLASFKCSPDPVRDAAAVAPPPVVVDLPPGWRQGEAGPANIGWQGDQGSVVFRMAALRTDDNEIFRVVANGMLQALGGGVDSTEDVRGRHLLIGHVNAGGRQDALAIVVPCQPRPLVGLYIGDISGPLAHDLLLSARCK
jgi:hypothetical protein